MFAKPRLTNIVNQKAHILIYVLVGFTWLSVAWSSNTMYKRVYTFSPLRMYIYMLTSSYVHLHAKFMMTLSIVNITTVLLQTLCTHQYITLAFHMYICKLYKRVHTMLQTPRTSVFICTLFKRVHTMHFVHMYNQYIDVHIHQSPI